MKDTDHQIRHPDSHLGHAHGAPALVSATSPPSPIKIRPAPRVSSRNVRSW